MYYIYLEPTWHLFYLEKALFWGGWPSKIEVIWIWVPGIYISYHPPFSSLFQLPTLLPRFPRQLVLPRPWGRIHLLHVSTPPSLLPPWGQLWFHSWRFHCWQTNRFTKLRPWETPTWIGTSIHHSPKWLTNLHNSLQLATAINHKQNMF